MLFNSYPFIFGFLPLTLLGFFFLGGKGRHRVVVAWLVGASLCFYGWWNPLYLWLVIASLLFNYAAGVALSGMPHPSPRKQAILTLGVSANLAALGYYKYANFFVNNLNILLHSHFTLDTIILPLGISFFTFQQIAYLVDAYRGETREYNFLDYCLFVTFFPQWIAGPIVHHAEVLPQFERADVYRPKKRNLAVGLTIFAIGLFKKTVLADGIALHANAVFNAAAAGAQLTFLEAWGGALAYTLQLYFDFSGYSDMAIGLGRMFNIKLPLNFYSPYKSTSIIEFWRRWHMTLSRFLRDYLYIALGGNRKGPARRYVNLFLTMLLGGLWHGAGWTFIIWGGLHGLYLIINHAWRAARQQWGLTWRHWSTQELARGVTFVAVVIGWVFFRASDVTTATHLLWAMGGGSSFLFPAASASMSDAVSSLALREANFHATLSPLVFGDTRSGIAWILGLLLVARFFPNTHEVMRRFRATCNDYIDPLLTTPDWLRWRPTRPWAFAIATLLFIAVFHLANNSEFLYFQF